MAPQLGGPVAWVAGPQVTAALHPPEKRLSCIDLSGSMWCRRPPGRPCCGAQRQAARADGHRLQPGAFSLQPHASRRHEKVVTHAAAVLDLEPANAYDRGQAHMWRATGREALGDFRGAIADLKVCRKSPNPSPIPIL